MEKIKVIALCGKAGSGKDTLLRQVHSDNYHKIVSCTTRPPREGEIDGVNYHFLTIQEFTNKLLNGDMLEATEFRNWHYGTLLSTLDTDKINIGVFNPEGIRCLIEDNIVETIVVYVQCSDKIRMLRQLNREQSPDVHEIVRRFGTDEADFFNFEKEFISYYNENENDLVNFQSFLDKIAQED